jgi:ubiquinone/menaquinone biosynthesis C-methylase UbiE
MTTDPWTQLADEYAAYRLGYSNELYDTIAAFGLRRGATILDVGCGTGIASAPFTLNGFPVTGVDPSEGMLAKAKEQYPDAVFVQGSAEALPFPNERFDVAIAAQMFHWVDRARALDEMQRVLRPAGMIAIWWKHLMARDVITDLRDDAFRSIGIEPPQSGLTGGFKEFYAAHKLTEQTLRVIPWRTSMPLEQFLGYERSRRSVRIAAGDKAPQYFAALEQRLRERLGDGNPTVPLAYVHYLYLAKKR